MWAFSSITDAHVLKDGCLQLERAERTEDLRDLREWELYFIGSPK